MHYFILSFLCAFGLAQAQKIELDKVTAYPAPELVSAPLVVASDDPPDVAAPPVKPIEAEGAPASARRRWRRRSHLLKRDGDCAPEPSGAGPVPDPDTADEFLDFSSLQVRSERLNLPSYS